jgi:3-dehydroquinate dehydratase/shikimate dehydrogenase
MPPSSQTYSRMIAVALNEPTTEHGRAGLRTAATVADIVELRIDLMQEYDLPHLLADRPCPVIVTCRAAREGGAWQGTEGARLDVLRKAIDLGAEYVDVEADAIHLIRERGQSRLIASSHDFERMPADVSAHWRELAATGADVVKIVGMASDARDVVPIVETLAAADRPTIAIAMGPAGLASRVLALREPQCLLTFCALENGGGTAPGQIGAAEMLSVYGARSLSRASVMIGIVGPSADDAAVRHWNSTLRGAGHDVVVVPLVVPDGDALADMLDALAPLGARGYSIARPYQEAAAQIVDGLEPSACRVGRVNVVQQRDGRLTGTWAASDDEVAALLLVTATQAPHN